MVRYKIKLIVMAGHSQVREIASPFLPFAFVVSTQLYGALSSSECGATWPDWHNQSIFRNRLLFLFFAFRVYSLIWIQALGKGGQQAKLCGEVEKRRNSNGHHTLGSRAPKASLMGSNDTTGSNACKMCVVCLKRNYAGTCCSAYLQAPCLSG